MRLLIGLILIVVGVLAVVAGVLYLTQPAHALPTFMPGHLAHASGKHVKRGIVGVIVGGVVFLVGAVLTASSRRSAW